MTGPVTLADLVREDKLLWVFCRDCCHERDVNPATIPLPRPSGNHVSIGGVLAALWNHPEGSASIIKPSTAERLDSFASGRNVGLISASRSGVTMDVNTRRWVELYAYIWPRFGSIDVDVRFSEHGPLQPQTLTERCYLLLGGRVSTVAISKGSYASMERSTIRGLSSINPMMREACICWARAMVWSLAGSRLSASGSSGQPGCRTTSGSSGAREPD